MEINRPNRDIKVIVADDGKTFRVIVDGAEVLKIYNIETNIVIEDGRGKIGTYRGFEPAEFVRQTKTRVEKGKVNVR